MDAAVLYSGAEQDDGPSAFRQAEKRFQLHKEQQLRYKKGRPRGGKLVTRPTDMTGVVDLCAPDAQQWLADGTVREHVVQVPHDQKAYAFRDHPGLIYLPNCIPVGQQLNLMEAALTDYPNPPARTNLTLHYGPIQDIWQSAQQGLRLNWTRKEDVPTGPSKRTGCTPRQRTCGTMSAPCNTTQACSEPASAGSCTEMTAQLNGCSSLPEQVGVQHMDKQLALSEPAVDKPSELTHSPTQVSSSELSASAVCSAQQLAQSLQPRELSTEQSDQSIQSPAFTEALTHNNHLPDGVHHQQHSLHTSDLLSGHVSRDSSQSLHESTETMDQLFHKRDQSLQEGDLDDDSDMRSDCSSEINLSLQQDSADNDQSSGPTFEDCWSTDGPGPSAAQLLKKLRWATLGPQFNWTAREYEHGTQHRQLPDTLSTLARQLAAAVDAATALLQAPTTNSSCSNCTDVGAAAPPLQPPVTHGQDNVGCSSNGGDVATTAEAGCSSQSAATALADHRVRMAATTAAATAPRSCCNTLLAATSATATPSDGCQDVSRQPYKPDAAIVNYYYEGDMLGGHTDDVENDMSQPIVAVSLGCPAIFLMGGRTKAESPTALLVRSGDVVVLSGAARVCYHGVPRIFTDQPLPEGLQPNSVPVHLRPIAEHMRQCRINISVRAVA